jgi:hypothetical protein
MVKAGPDIEQNVVCDEGNVLIQRMIRQSEPVVVLAIGIEHFGDRIFVATNREAESALEIVEVLFCPVKVELPRGITYSLPPNGTLGRG